MLWRDKLGLRRLPPCRARAGTRWVYVKNGLLRHKHYPQHRPGLRAYLKLYRLPLVLALSTMLGARSGLLAGSGCRAHELAHGDCGPECPAASIRFNLRVLIVPRPSAEPETNYRRGKTSVPSVPPDTDADVSSAAR